MFCKVCKAHIKASFPTTGLVYSQQTKSSLFPNSMFGEKQGKGGTYIERKSAKYCFDKEKQKTEKLVVVKKPLK